MSLVIRLAQNAAATHPDKFTLKIERESIVPTRTPIAISLPGGTIVGIDLGRIITKIMLEGIVDETLSELFVDTVAGTPPFIAGETITGTAGWDASVTPNSTSSPAFTRSTPTAVIVSGLPNLTTPTSLFISGLNPSTEFFVDNEPLTTIRGANEATCQVNEAFPTKQRLEQAARYFYASGVLTLTTRSGSYSVQINNFSFDAISGAEDRYIFRGEFIQIA